MKKTRKSTIVEVDGIKYRVPSVIAAILHVVSEERDALKGALRWASGSSHFHPGGEAHKYWKQICRPLLDLTPAPWYPAKRKRTRRKNTALLLKG